MTSTAQSSSSGGDVFPQRVSQPRRPSKNSVALDQWRGLALVLVLISHGFFFTNRVNGAGRVGVNLFFFISGILVFRSLEKDKRGRWELTRGFWWRRFRRLYPALIMYMVTMWGVVYFAQRLPNLPDDSDLASYRRAVPWALAYLVNYHKAPLALGHLWSLSCEMQFYFLAPIIFLVGGKMAGWRTGFFAFLALGLSGLGLLYPFVRPNLVGKYHFEFAVWPMMAGFLCECVKERFGLIPVAWVKIILRSAAVALALAMSVMLCGVETKKFVIATGALLLLPCMLGYVFGVPLPGAAGGFLAWIGERTYSIYLWQQPLTICGFLPNLFHPVGAVASIFVGAVWFHFFERPFLSPNRSHRLATIGPGAQ